MPGESFEVSCCCTPIPGTTLPIAPYVVSLNNLNGLVTIAPDGGISVRSEGNVLYIGANGSAGLGTVTSVNVSSSNTNLVVGGGPVTTTGTFTFALAGNLNSISSLVMAADQMIYATGAGTFVASSITTFGRSLIDDANAGAAQTTLGLVIGTNVQAWSADLDSFVTNASWSGANLTLAGTVTIGGDVNTGGDANISNDVFCNNLTAVGIVTAANFAGDGSNLTNLQAGDIASGTLAVARGGTNIASYTTGDLIAASGATTLSKIADVAVGSYLRSGGVAALPVWSTLILPNAATQGDLFYASTLNTMGRLADVATGNTLLSGGVGVAPAWGKVTSSHVNNTIPTMAAGVNSDITTLASQIQFSSGAIMNAPLVLASELWDGAADPGTSGYILTSTGTSTLWSNQITVSTIQVDGLVTLEGTITAPGSTGAKTINQQCGTVRFAAGAGTLIITNSLALAASTRALATVCSVDTTLKSVAAVVTDGFITLTGNGNANAETEVYWELRGIV